MKRDASWMSLGEAIERGRERHARDSRSDFTRTVRRSLEALLETQPDAADVLAEIAVRLERATLDDWTRSSIETTYPRLEEQRAWDALDELWQTAQCECERTNEDPWETFAEMLREELEPLRDELLAAVDACTAARTSIEAFDHVSSWPLEYLGTVHSLVAQAREATAAHTGIPIVGGTAEVDVSDGPSFTIATEAHALEDGKSALERRTAWASVLFALQDQLAPLRDQSASTRS